MEASPFVGSVNETNIYPSETKTRDLKLVPQFDTGGLTSKLEYFLDKEDDDDNRVALLVEMVEKLPAGTADWLAAMTSCDDDEVIEVAMILIPETLARAIPAGAMSFEELDRLREAWAGLMRRDDALIRSIAQRTFTDNKDRLMEDDTVTYHWLKDLAVEEKKEVKGSSYDYMQRAGQA